MAETVKFDDTTIDQPDVQSGKEAIDITTIDKYQFIEEAFNGTGGFEDGTYLEPHPREVFYTKRRRQAHYSNYVNQVITAMYKPVFAEKIKRDFGNNDRFDLFVDDCTLNGTCLTSFVKLCVKYVRMHGTVFVIVDNRNQETAQLRQDAINQKLNPYCYIKKAYELNSDGTNFDDYGQLIEIMYFDHSETVIENGVEKTTKYYRQWSAVETKLFKEKELTGQEKTFEEKYIEVEQQINFLGSIPGFLMYEEPLDNPKNLFADTLRYQLAKINTTIFNQDSERREVARNQGFGILTVPDGGNSDDCDITVGTNNFLAYPADSSNKPEMISVNPDLITALAEERHKTMESLIAVAEQSGVQGINKSKDAKSGLAYAFEFFAYESTLKSSSVIATNIENSIVNLFNDWTGENVEYDMNYPTNFKPNQTEEKYNQLTETMEQPNLSKQFYDKCEIEKYKIMFPDDEEGLEQLKKQQLEKEPELNTDIENNSDES